MFSEPIPSRETLQAAFPGFAVSLLAAITAQFLSEHYGAPAMLLALLLGLALNFLADEGTRTAPGGAARRRTVAQPGCGSSSASSARAAPSKSSASMQVFSSRKVVSASRCFSPGTMS